MSEPSFVTFGEKGVKGDPGEQGEQGPMGGAPDVQGNVILDPLTRSIQGPFTRDYVNRVDVAGALLTILEFSLPANYTGKLVIECKAESADLSKVQTLDAARRVKIVAGSPTLVVSGSDIADDGDALGATFVIETYFAFVTAFRVRASGFTGRASAAVRVLL